MMTIKYDENNNSKLATAILYEWFKNETEVNVNTIDSVPPEDLINTNLGEMLIFVTAKAIPTQWVNAFKALEDRGTHVCVISNCSDSIESLKEINIDYNVSDVHSIAYNAWDMLFKTVIKTESNNNKYAPKMIEYTEPDNANYNAFSIGFDIRDLGDPKEFFEQMIPKNNYNIFNPDKWESQRMNGFAKHCISDGEAIIRYQQWSAKQLKSDAASKYILKDSNTNLKVVALNSQINPIYAYNMYSKVYDIIYTYFFNGENWTYNIMKGSFSSIKKETYVKYANFISNCTSADFNSAYWLLFTHGGEPINVPNGEVLIIKNYKKRKFDIFREGI